MSPTKPRNVRPSRLESSVSAACPEATASTRRPSAASRAFSSSRWARASSSGTSPPSCQTRRHRSSTCRGAPLTETRRRSPSWWNAAISLRALEKGTSATGGVRPEGAPGRARAAASRMARSTGSPAASSPVIGGCSRLAAPAVSSSRATASGTGPRDSVSSAYSAPAAQTRTTDITPEVSVRVLSVQTTVVDPSASTAASRRTSARRRAIRRRPIASAIVATAGRPSGTAATARAIAVSTIRPQGAPCATPSTATTAAVASATHTRRWPSASSFRSSGVRSCGRAWTSAPTRPTSVSAPVAVTTIRPTPPATAVPR